MSNLRCALVALGSAGDVHPLLGIGQALRGRGHEVVVLGSPAFASDVASAGLSFQPVGDAADFDRSVAHPKVWLPIDGLGVMWRYLLRPALAPVCDWLLTRRRSAQLDVVVAGPAAMGARVAQEASGLPLLSVYTAATMLRSVHDPMTVAQWRVPAWLPRSARRLVWGALDHYKLEPLVRPALDRLRTAHRLPAIGGSIFGQWVHSPVAGLTLFPRWFAAASPDWPAQVRQSGFVLYDEPGARMPEGLAGFLDAGEAPVVFMPGTAQVRAGRFFEAAVEACRLLGARGVMVGMAQPEEPRSGPHPGGRADMFFSLRGVPFGQLLPRARALVHHGGIGSCAQALRAGIGQVVVPSAYDQFDNGMRVERLGVGRVVPMRGVTGRALARALQACGAGPVAQLEQEAAAARALACDIVESIAR